MEECTGNLLERVQKWMSCPGRFDAFLGRRGFAITFQCLISVKSIGGHELWFITNLVVSQREWGYKINRGRASVCTKIGQ